MNLNYLTKSAAPWLHVCTGSVGDIANALSQWELEASGKRIARIVRGRKCMSVAGFFDEAAAALQFPVTFGENWDAFADCLRDWHRVPDKAAVAICIIDADKLLSSAPVSAAETLAEVLMMCAEEVNSPPKPGKPRPLHVLFHYASAKSATSMKRWNAVGLALSEK